MAASTLKQTIKGNPADGKAMSLREIAAFVERARGSGASGHEHVQVTATLGGKVKRLAVEIERSPKVGQPAQPYRLRSGGTVEVVGEAHYQDALERAAGGRTDDGANLEVTATLVPEPDNPYDPNAIAVRVGGATIGFLSREDAIDYAPVMQRLAAMGSVGCCQARIRGGWDRGKDDRGHFGIVLALASPEKALG